MDDRSRADGRRHGRRPARTGARAVRVAATAAVALALAGLTAVLAPQPAGAGGGDWLYPARDRYEPGQTVTLIGYGLVADPAWRENGPYYAYLRVDPVRAEADAARADAPSAPARYIHPTDLRVGQVTVEDAAEPTPGSYWRPQRASVTFSLPDDLAPMAYTVVICNDPCTTGLDNFWPEPVNVGVDPAYPIVRDWPLTDPAIRWLEDNALLAGPSGKPVTAADVRSGRVPTPPPAAAPAPMPVPEATNVPDAAPRPSTEGTVAVENGDPSTASEDAAPADEGDGGALAWWIVGEVTLLVVGCAVWRRWGARRRRPHLDVVRTVEDAAPSAEVVRPDRGASAGPVVPTAAPAASVDEGPDPTGDGGAPGGTHPPLRVRL